MRPTNRELSAPCCAARVFTLRTSRTGASSAIWAWLLSGAGPSSNTILSEEVRQLKRENGHLTQRLARAELIIDVQKQVSALLRIPLATLDSDESSS